MNVGLMSDYDALLRNAHVDYGALSPDESEGQESYWRARLRKAPNGGLIQNNAFLSGLQQRTMWFAHITSGLEHVLQTGTLQSSDGALTAALYCVPAYARTGGNFEMHNLGNWIYQEKTRQMKVGLRSSVDVVLIQITFPSKIHSMPQGIDYTRLGMLHYQIFHEYKYLLSRVEQSELDSRLTGMLTANEPFLVGLEDWDAESCENPEKATQLLDRIAMHVPGLPILGYLYFEVLLEYLLYYQDDEISRKYLAKGEFYNDHYKSVATRINTSLYRQKFQLHTFGVPTRQLVEIMRSFTDKNVIFEQFDEQHFITFMAERLLYYIHTRLWRPDVSTSGSDPVRQRYAPLVGHLIYRELRTFDRYIDFYQYFDQLKALAVWNYWNQQHVIIPFNGIIPKGEVGINPAYADDVQLQVFESQVVHTSRNYKLRIVRPLAVRLTPQLVSLHNTSLRNTSARSV